MRRNTIVLICMSLVLTITQDTMLIASRERKASQPQEYAAPATQRVQQQPKTKRSQHTTAAPARRKSSSSQPENSEIKSMIEEYVQKVDQITEKYCDGHEKKPDQKTMSEHTKKIQQAYESYEKLYRSDAGNKGKEVNKDDNQRIKKANKKLFTCKNIQNRVWTTIPKRRQDALKKPSSSPQKNEPQPQSKKVVPAV